MVGRLVIGLVKGVLVGAVLAAVLVLGLHIETFGGALFAYLAAVVSGVLVGFVAGKPIWQKGARIEAGLKAFAGALLAAGAMFAIRRWLGMHVDLSAFHAGSGAIGDLPATSLPLVATALAVIFELDNTGDDDASPRESAKATRARVAAGSAAGALDEEDEPEAGARQTRRKG